MTGPSDKAIEAAVEAFRSRGWWVRDEDFESAAIEARRVLDAAYPIIRADVIAEVVHALRPGRDIYDYDRFPGAADFIEREFGGQR